MKKLTVIALLLCLAHGGYSQEIYFLTGKNYTRFQLKYSGPETVNTLLKKGSGDSYELGMAFPIKIQYVPAKGRADQDELGVAVPNRSQDGPTSAGVTSDKVDAAMTTENKLVAVDSDLKYIVGLTINQYNAQAGDQVRNYEWTTDYIGISNGLLYTFLKTVYVDYAVQGAFTFATMVSGSQQINSSRFNLAGQDDFKGINFSPLAGLQAKSKLSKYGNLSLGYTFSKSYNLSNSSDKRVSFVTNQVVFGLSFEFN